MNDRQEQFDEAVHNLADELYYNETLSAEWLTDVADEDDVFDLAREAFVWLGGKPSGELPQDRIGILLRRLLRQYANWCEERAREQLLREAADDEYDRRAPT